MKKIICCLLVLGSLVCKAQNELSIVPRPVKFQNATGNFLLNEITDTLPIYVVPYINTQGQKQGKRQKAISQLLSSLTLIMNVLSISAFANTHTFRQCCFFNRQSMSPPTITATIAFNRLSTLATSGLKMSNTAIEALGFEFWEYSGSQVYNL